MKKLLFLVLTLFPLFYFSQVDRQNPRTPLVKDPYFNRAQPQANTGAPKVKLIHSDKFERDPAKYGGNPFFSGNVQMEHQGATLNADIVVFYNDENFVKAIGNVVLVTDGNRITSNEMEYDGDTQRGIARGNVVLTDPRQTITTETLYYDRIPNTAYFNTGGTIQDGQNVMYTKSATYNLNTKMINFVGNVNIDNGQYRVEGTNIVQNQNTNTADFTGPTYIINKANPQNYVYTENGRYLMNQKEVYLNKKSRIHYNGKILYGDKMYYNQLTGFGRAEGNVMLDNPRENSYIKGGYGEIYEKKDSAVMTQKPYAVKIFKADSLYFSAEKILAFQKADSTRVKKSFLRAFRKVRLYKSNAQGRSDSLSYNETDGVLHLVNKPIFWSGERQVTGDTIKVYTNPETEQIDSLKVIDNAFAISKADSLNLKDEFNQIKGKLMTVFYEENEIKLAKVIGNAQAITYADDQDEKTKEVERIGVALSTCGVIEALFADRQVQIISCNIGASSDVFPMSMIAREKRFFPEFNWNTKDRLRKWTDIFLDSPNYRETAYTSDDALFKKAEELRKAEEEKSRPKTPARERKL